MPELRAYQKIAVEQSLKNLITRKGYGLLLAPGLGKTGASITVINALSAIEGLSRVLVTAPAKVLSHWQREAVKWNSVLPVYCLDGLPEDRLAILKQKRPGIYVISHALLYWLSKQRQYPYDMFVIDEGSKFRNWSAERTKGAKRLSTNAGCRLLLTGSPAPNCPSEFFAQQFMLDRGATLGTAIGRFRDKYMYRGGHENREWIFDDNNEQEFRDKLAPWYLRQEAVGNLDLPPVSYHELEVTLPQAAKKAYRQLERDLYTEYKTEELFAFSGSQKYSLCRQMASGGCYIHDLAAAIKTALPIHTAKIEALRDLADESPTPLLVAYQFTHELDHIRNGLGQHIPAINGKVSARETDAIIQRWQQKQIPILLAQSQAISHGVDGLQYGGSTIVWYTLTDSLEVHDQLNCRIDRSGQTAPVSIFYLVAKGTIDTAMLRLIRRKSTVQAELLNYLDTKGEELRSLEII